MSVLYAKAGAKNWSSASSWSTTGSGGSDNSGPPSASTDVIFDTNCTGVKSVDTVSCCCQSLICQASANKITFTATKSLSVSGNVTFYAGMTLAGTGVLSINAEAVLNSGGVTFPGILDLAVLGTVTLGSNWTVTGVVENLQECVLNGYQITCNGGFSIGASLSGTTLIIIGGSGKIVQGVGLWSSDLAFNCADVTVSEYYRMGGVTTYTAGTVTTAGLVVNIWGDCVFNTSGMTWETFSINADAIITLTSNLACTNFIINGPYNLTFAGVYKVTGSSIVLNDGCSIDSNGSVWTDMQMYASITLLSALVCSGELFLSINATFVGAYNISCGTWRIESFTESNVITLVAGTTLTITAGMHLIGLDYPDASLIIQSDTPSAYANLKYLGTASDCKVFAITFIDIDASLSAQNIDNWMGGDLTRCLNITNRTSADFLPEVPIILSPPIIESFSVADSTILDQDDFEMYHVDSDINLFWVKDNNSFQSTHIDTAGPYAGAQCLRWDWTIAGSGQQSDLTRYYEGHKDFSDLDTIAMEMKATLADVISPGFILVDSNGLWALKSNIITLTTDWALLEVVKDDFDCDEGFDWSSVEYMGVRVENAPNSVWSLYMDSFEINKHTAVPNMTIAVSDDLFQEGFEYVDNELLRKAWKSRPEDTVLIVHGSSSPYAGVHYLKWSWVTGVEIDTMVTHSPMPIVDFSNFESWSMAVYITQLGLDYYSYGFLDTNGVMAYWREDAPAACGWTALNRDINSAQFTIEEGFDWTHVVSAFIHFYVNSAAAEGNIRIDALKISSSYHPLIKATGIEYGVWDSDYPSKISSSRIKTIFLNSGIGSGNLSFPIPGGELVVLNDILNPFLVLCQAWDGVLGSQFSNFILSLLTDFIGMTITDTSRTSNGTEFNFTVTNLGPHRLLLLYVDSYGIQIKSFTGDGVKQITGLEPITYNFTTIVQRDSSNLADIGSVPSVYGGGLSRARVVNVGGM